MGLGKFADSEFWKLTGKCCEFIGIQKVIEDNGEYAMLQVSVNEQLHREWITRVDSILIRVTGKTYGRYQPYRPRRWQL